MRITLHLAISYSQADIYDMFNLPLSMIVVEQCNALIAIIQSVIPTEQLHLDVWSFLGHSGKIPTRKAYFQVIKPESAPPPFKWIWKSCCLPKHKFFFWVLLQDRLNTKELLARKNFHIDSKYCVLCDEQIQESMIHLFFECDFSQTF
jgi:hypothetical protein